MIWPLLAACGSPFENDPPKLLAVNGVEYRTFQGIPDDPALLAEPGTDFEIVVDLRDPEGKHVRVWWPRSPPGWDFDPDATTGVWHVPDPVGWWGPLELLLEDTDRNDPQIATYNVPIMPAWFDTGTVR